MTGPVARSLQLLRKEGFVAESVTHWNPHAMRTFDLFGWIDLVCVRADFRGVLGVQSTTAHNLPARLEKAKCNAKLAEWLAAGNSLEAHGWALRGARGERKLWTVRRVILTPEHLKSPPENSCDSA